MSPEFHGIHLLYLDSKIIALRTVTMMLLLLAVSISIYALSQERAMLEMRHAMEEGNNVKCEDGYISKIVEGAKVSCVMKRVAPGDVTYRAILKREQNDRMEANIDGT